jgi:hypothetical protein
MRWSTTVRWPRNSDDSMITGEGTPSNAKSPPENVEGITGNQIFGISSGNGKLTLLMSNPYCGETPLDTPQCNKAATLPVCLHHLLLPQQNDPLHIVYRNGLQLSLHLDHWLYLALTILPQ